MRRVLAAFAVATLAFAGAAAAQATSDSTVSGVVVSSTSDSLVVRLDDGTQRTFVTDTTTTLPPGRLVEGNRVTVRFHSLDGGRWQATTVSFAGDQGAVERSPASPDRPGDASLPSTASPMPLLALIGFAGLAGAAALRLLRPAA